MLLLLILQISFTRKPPVSCHFRKKANDSYTILDEDDEITKESVTTISVVEGSTPSKGVESNKGI